MSHIGRLRFRSVWLGSLGGGLAADRFLDILAAQLTIALLASKIIEGEYTLLVPTPKDRLGIPPTFVHGIFFPGHPHQFHLQWSFTHGSLEFSS